MDFVGKAVPLSRDGFNSAATALNVGAPEIWAVVAVETPGCGFLPDRRPLILFERHIFHRETGGAFDAMHPSISSAMRGGYAGGAGEYPRLAEAIALDRRAALESTSWGIAQVMGFNAELAGFSGIEMMVAAIMDGEDAQMAAAAAFMTAEGLDTALAAHDWAKFAAGYNGPDFKKNKYDVRLAAAFSAFSAGTVPDLDVRLAQVFLMFLGIDVGRIDGIAGKRTRSAVVQFRQQAGLPVSDKVDAELLAALAARVENAIV
jgi:hypothetical protein